MAKLWGPQQRSSIKRNWSKDRLKTDPEVIWDLEIGLGYSSVIYSNGFAFSQGYNDGRNTLYCVKSDSGEIIWKHSFPCEKDPNILMEVVVAPLQLQVK